MLIGGFQKCSLIEYPGQISAVLFTRGCNFRCPYCYNPELVEPRLYSGLLPEEEIVSFLEKRRGILDALVITGGEPTLQEDLLSFMRRIKDMGYRVKLDTNGSSPEITARAAGLADYLAMDVKAPPGKYAAAAGKEVDTGRIKESISAIMESGAGYEFRTTVARGMFSAEDMEKLGGLIKGAKLHFLQNLLITEKISGRGLSKCSDEEIENFRDVLGRYADECRIR